MGKNNNLNDFLTDIADAIRTKKGTEDPINAQDFATEISTISGGNTGSTPAIPSYTGHADAEGLKAIGWTDEDIAYYQENGVNWNEEDDEWHKVTDDNKALYGVLTASNISTYKDRIVYLPKIDTSGVTNMSNMFGNCYSLVSIPQLDTNNCNNFSNAFRNCYSFVVCPPLATSKAISAGSMFSNCYSLEYVAPLDFSGMGMYSPGIGDIFYNCCSLKKVEITSFGKLGTSQNLFYGCRVLVSLILPPHNFASFMQNFTNCNSLTFIPQLDFSNTYSNSDVLDTFSFCYSLINIKIINAKTAISFKNSALLSKDSLLYLINNEATTSAITITLHSYAYERLATDADVVAALANHPNISLAK